MYSPLFFSDFFFRGGGGRAVSSIQNAKADMMTAPRSFRQYLIFVCFWACKQYVMLRHPGKHIHALSNVDDFPVQQDRVNSCPLKLRR